MVVLDPVGGGGSEKAVHEAEGGRSREVEGGDGNLPRPHVLLAEFPVGSRVRVVRTLPLVQLVEPLVDLVDPEDHAVG